MGALLKHLGYASYPKDGVYRKLAAAVPVSTTPARERETRIEPPLLSGIRVTAPPPPSGRRGSKYDPLRDYLLKQHLREIELTFGEIENILGFPLPPVSERPQWWANQVAPGRPQREAWRAGGYDAFLVAGSRNVRFRKVP
jgi:hypothetical protein